MGLAETELTKSHLSLCAVPHGASKSVVFDPSDVFESMLSRIEDHWLETQISSKQRCCFTLYLEHHTQEAPPGSCPLVSFLVPKELELTTDN